jgi:hypothetical protein
MSKFAPGPCLRLQGIVLHLFRVRRRNYGFPSKAEVEPVPVVGSTGSYLEALVHLASISLISSQPIACQIAAAIRGVLIRDTSNVFIESCVPRIPGWIDGQRPVPNHGVRAFVSNSHKRFAQPENSKFSDLSFPALSMLSFDHSKVYPKLMFVVGVKV